MTSAKSGLSSPLSDDLLCVSTFQSKHEDTDYTNPFKNLNKTYHINTGHDTIRTSPSESNHFTSHGCPPIGVAVNRQKTLFLNMTDMDRIATDK